MPAVHHDRLRHRRDELGLSNPELASRMGRKVGYVQNVMAGVDNPGWPVIYELSRALDYPVERIAIDPIPAMHEGERTPQGDPSEPPVQPKNEPKGPARRQDREGQRRGPKRAEQGSAA